MPFPLLPSLNPKPVDSIWFSVDSPCDEEAEVQQLEQEHQAWLDSIVLKNADFTPIGKNVSENADDTDDDEEDDDNDDDDESDSRDEEDEDEMDMEISYERNSPVDVRIRMVPGHGVR